MAQHDFVIDNATGLSVRTDINNAFAAIRSSNSGSVEPSSIVAGQIWWNTGSSVLSVRNQLNNAWLPIATNVSATYLPLTGGTMTGGLTLDPASGAAQLILDKNAGSGSQLIGKQGALYRWQVALGDSTAEGGANTGSNFTISRYADAGASTPIDVPLAISRATGQVTVASDPTTASSVATKSYVDAIDTTNTYVRGHRQGSGVGATGNNAFAKINIGTLQFNAGGWTLASGSLNVPKTGTYVITASLTILAPTVSTVLTGIAINGSAAPVCQGRQYNAAGGSQNLIVSCTHLVALTANDKIDLLGFCSTAAAQVNEGADGTFLHAHYISD